MTRTLIRASLLLVVLGGPTFAFLGPAWADTGGAALSDCHLTGPVRNPSADCRALRSSLRGEVDNCMRALRDKADALPGGAYTHNAHTNRSRLLICDLEVRQRLGLAD